MGKLGGEGRHTGSDVLEGEVLGGQAVLFSGEAVVEEVALGGRLWSGPRHAHFRCSACGAIEDVAYAIPARTLKALASEHGFAIDSERVTFEGRCAACGAS